MLEFATGHVAFILGVPVAVLIALIGFRYRRKRRLHKYYRLIWKKSSSIKAKEIMMERPFHKYYYPRDHDTKLADSLTDKRNVLLVGRPLSGKSRAVYQSLTCLKKPQDVLMPRCTDIDLETFEFPFHIRWWRQKSVFIDDLHRFVEQQNFQHLLSTCVRKSILILASCRSGLECEKMKNAMAKNNISLESIFGNNIIELDRIGEETGKEIAQEAGKDWRAIKFDGTPGSIFMPLAEMETRFSESTNEERTILRGIRSLYLCGVYQGKLFFPMKWIRVVCEKAGLDGKDLQWNSWLGNLKNKEFIFSLANDAAQCEEAYIENVVRPDIEIELIDNLG